MTLTLRNYILVSGLILSGMILAGAITGVISILNFLPIRGSLISLLFSRSPGPQIQAVTVLGICILSLGATLYMYFSFRKTASPEIFFFLIFLLSLSCEAARIGCIWAYLNLEPPFLMSLFTRAVFFGRLAGIFSLVMSGLFNLGFQFQKMETLLGSILIVALLFAATSPIDTAGVTGAYLFPFGYGLEYRLLILVLAFFSVLNFMISGITNHNSDHLFMGLSLFLVIAGWSGTMLFSPVWVQAAGLLMITLGTLLFAKVTHEVYLWT